MEGDDDNIGADLDFRDGQISGAREIMQPSPNFPSIPANVLQANPLLQGLLDKISKSIQQKDNFVATTGTFVPATDPAFVLRLQRAMEKNFEYLIR